MKQYSQSGVHLATPIRWKTMCTLVAFFGVLAVQTSGSAGTLLALPHDPQKADRPWSWQRIIDNMEKIRAVGYTAILISPHQKACGGGVSAGYDPEDFTKFDSAHGSESQLAALIKAAHHAGVQIYADMVINHLCGNQTYPRFSQADFHNAGDIRDWHDQWQVENGSLYGFADLRQESEYVRGELWNFLVKSNDMGFDGYRWDAAKHVPKWYWRDHIVNNVNKWGKYNFGEVYDGNLDYLQEYVATGMAVTDYNLYFAMKESFRFAGNLAALDGAGFAARNGPKALTFVENHDTGTPANSLLAYAFITAYPGYPCFYNTSLDDNVIKNLVWIHNTLAHGDYLNRYKDHDTLIFERRGNLLAGINQSDRWISRWVQTSWVNAKLHDYTFHIDDKWTNNEGYIEMWIPPMGYVMMAP
jgi:alpha-amylase